MHCACVCVRVSVLLFHPPVTRSKHIWPDTFKSGFLKMEYHFTPLDAHRAKFVSVCVCVCMCVSARLCELGVCVCVCVCVV